MIISVEYTKDILLNHAGLIGLTHLIQNVPPRPFFKFAGLDRASTHWEYFDADILKSMLCLLCIGFSAFEDVDHLRGSPLALGMRRLPSKETLRQRMDHLAASCESLSSALNAWSLELLLAHAKPSPSAGTDICSRWWRGLPSGRKNISAKR